MVIMLESIVDRFLSGEISRGTETTSRTAAHRAGRGVQIFPFCVVWWVLEECFHERDLKKLYRCVHVVKVSDITITSNHIIAHIIIATGIWSISYLQLLRCHCEKSEDIWLSLVTIAPYTHIQQKKQRVTTKKNATKNFDCTTIAGRLRTVSWSNDSHPILNTMFH